MRTKFNGERLKKARIFRGFTVAELAEQVGCQRQTLSMYEISKSQPTDPTIVRQLSDVLNFPEKFFYEKPEPCTSGTVYFRSLLTTNKKYRTEQVVKMEFLSQVYELLQDYVEFPQFEPLVGTENMTPEDVALELRKRWNLGLGPIDNLVSVAEQHGILVTTFDTRTNDVDAFSQYVGTADSSTYIIAYSSNKKSAARIHFDVAHELGHICLHNWSEDLDELTKDEFKRREQEANAFAAAFLLPEVSFKIDAERGSQSIPHYKELKRKWKVSIAAMIRRAQALNVMTMQQYKFLLCSMQKRGMRKTEPLDDELLTASPAMLKTAVLMLLQENVFTADEFIETLSNEYDLSICAEDVEYLLNLPEGTLVRPKIIDFKSLQVKSL